MRYPFGSNKQIAWALALVVLRMAVFGVVLYGVLRPLLGSANEPRSWSAKLVEHLTLTTLAIVFAFVLLVRLSRATWRDLGFSRERLRSNLLLGFAVFAFGLIIVAVRLSIDDASFAAAFDQVLSYNPKERVLMVLIGVHVIFGEELLFRGYLQPGLRARLSPALAIGMTSLVFALYHADLAPASFAGHFAWGIVWGLARERSGSTVPSSIAHFLNWSILGWL